MRVEVISTVNEARADRIHHRTAIVIDVLRATSTIVAALDAGVAGIIPSETVMEARALQRPGDIMAGERFGRKIAGFELGNSPGDFNTSAYKGKRIILTTTNGTRALQKALRAEAILAGSLTNASACAAAAARYGRDIVILCAGSHDEFALEDGLCAGLLIDRLQANSTNPIDMDDFGAAMLGLYHNSANRAVQTLLASTTGKRLSKLGFGEDIERCALIDSSITVPRLQGDMLITGS